MTSSSSDSGRGSGRGSGSAPGTVPGAVKDPSSDPNGIAQVLADLQKQYVLSLPAKAQNIENQWATRRIQDIETEFHKLKGTGKTYGLPEISQIGEVSEALCQASEDVLAQALPLAVQLLRKVHQARTATAGAANGLHPTYDLNNDAGFLQLERLRQAHGKRR